MLHHTNHLSHLTCFIVRHEEKVCTLSRRNAVNSFFFFLFSRLIRPDCCSSSRKTESGEIFFFFFLFCSFFFYLPFWSCWEFPLPTFVMNPTLMMTAHKFKFLSFSTREHCVCFLVAALALFFFLIQIWRNSCTCTSPPSMFFQNRIHIV